VSGRSRWRRREGTLAGLGDDRLAGQGRQLGDDLRTRLAVDQDAAHGAGIADAQGGATAQALGGRAVGEVGLVAFAGVDDRQAGGTEGVHEPAQGGHDRLQAGDIVAERVAEAAGLDEVALHVDEDQGKPAGLPGERERLGHDLRHQWCPAMCEPSRCGSAPSAVVS
jgi:hypothetical protein